MKKILIIFTILMIVIFLVLFGNIINKMNSSNHNQYKISFVISGIGDKGFADMQLKGVEKAAKLFKIKHKLFITCSFDKIRDGILNAANEGYNIIICGNGFLAEKAILEVAPLFPKFYFICMDTELSYYPENVATVSFKQNEGSFLAGVLAANMTKTKKIGFIGGMNIPVITDFLIGFKQGINHENPDIKLFVKYCDEMKSEDPFQDEKAGQTITEDLMNSFNVDIIYAVAGKTNMGIYKAINGKMLNNNLVYAIGVDTDQDYLVKGQILTSMIKNLDTGIVYIVDKIINNNFQNKNFRIGLKENGINLSKMKFTKDIIGSNLIKYIEQLKFKIIENKIIIKSVY